MRVSLLSAFLSVFLEIRIVEKFKGIEVTVNNNISSTLVPAFIGEQGKPDLQISTMPTTTVHVTYLKVKAVR